MEPHRLALLTDGLMAPDCTAPVGSTFPLQTRASCAGVEDQGPGIKAEKSEGKPWMKGRFKGKAADSKHAEGHIVADPAKLALLLS